MAAPRGSTAALTVLCTAQFMVVLDVTVVAVALPSIQAELGFSASALQWVVTAYTLVFGGLLIAAGRAGDLFGRRRLFVLGLAIFTAASLGCGLAPSAGALIAFRVLQGLGAALVAPSALSLLTATFPDGPARRRAVGAWTAAAAGGGASGWVLGGLLTQGAGWEWVFFVNVPVGLACIALARPVLAESRAGNRAAGLDVPGALTVTLGLGALVFGLTRAEQAGPASPGALLGLAGGIALLIAFTAIERRAPRPLLPLGVLRSRPFAAANLAAASLTAATTPPMFLAVLYQQEVLGFSALRTGLACAPVNLAVVAGSAFAAGAGGAIAPRTLMTAGLGAVAAGSLALLGTGLDGGYLTALLPGFVLMGAGLGCASVASTASGTAAVGPGEQGLASGLLNATAQVGTVLGLAVLVSLAAARRDAPRAAEAAEAAQLAGYHWGFAGAATVAVAAAAATAWALRRSPAA